MYATFVRESPRMNPQCGFLTLVSAAAGTLTFTSPFDHLIVSVSADCTLTWAKGASDPGGVPTTGNVASDRGCRKLLAGLAYEIFMENGRPTAISFKQSSGGNVDLTVEAHAPVV